MIQRSIKPKEFAKARESFREYVRYHITPNRKYPNARLTMTLAEAMDYFDVAFDNALTKKRK